jgi:hypothetical protein
MPVETAAHVVIADRLKRAGEWVYARGYVDHPPFRSARIAAANLLRMAPPDLPLLVLRDQSLRALRELMLEQDRVLVVPTKAGDGVYRIPCSALYAKDGTRIPLKVDPLPRGSVPYVGPVGAVVVGCLAFDPHRRHLISFDIERTVDMLIKAYNGLQGGFKLSRKAPVIVMAADCQEAAGWRKESFGFTQADYVVTPTRLITLGTCKVSFFSGPDAAGVSPIITLRSCFLDGGLDYVRH